MKVSKATAYALHAMMCMVRHRTQLPVTTEVIAKAEGMPSAYLSKILQQLVKAGFLKSTPGARRGYDFAREPEDISMLELLNVMEGDHIFSDCLLKRCECGGTPDNCYIYGQWLDATRKIKTLFEETNLVMATWNHPEHRFSEMNKKSMPK